MKSEFQAEKLCLRNSSRMKMMRKKRRKFRFLCVPPLSHYNIRNLVFAINCIGSVELLNEWLELTGHSSSSTPRSLEWTDRQAKGLLPISSSSSSSSCCWLIVSELLLLLLILFVQHWNVLVLVDMLSLRCSCTERFQEEIELNFHMPCQSNPTNNCVRLVCWSSPGISSSVVP